MIYSLNKSPRETYPNQDIERKKKTPEWYCSNSKWIYSMFNSGNSCFSQTDIDYFKELKKYSNGCQDTEKYKNELSVKLNDRRTTFNKIDFEDLYSPMPKIMNKVIGTFLGQSHMITAKSVSENSKFHRYSKKATQVFALRTKPVKEEISKLATGGKSDMNIAMDKIFSDVSNQETEETIDIRDGEELRIVQNNTSKLNYEIATEKVIEATMELSNDDDIKTKMLIDMVVTNFMFARNVVVDNKFDKWEHIPIEDVILEYSDKSGFDNSRYGAIQEYWSIVDLRAKLDIPEEELRAIARKYQTYNKCNDFRVYDKIYKMSQSYGYDDFKIPVLDSYWQSNNNKYFNKVKSKAGGTRYYKGDFGKLKDNTKLVSTKTIEHCRWIMGTDIVFDNGELNWIPRKSTGEVSLPIYGERGIGRSIVDLSKHSLNQLAIISYKLQDAWFKAKGNGYAYDFSQIDDFAESTDGKFNPLDVIRIMEQSTGIPYRSRPVDDDPLYNSGQPVHFIQGGIGSLLNEFQSTRLMLLNDIAEMTGISSMESSYVKNGTATEARLAVASTLDVLKPLYNGFLKIKVKLCECSAYRSQILIQHSKDASKYYGGMIGETYVKALKDAYDIEPIQMGVSFEAHTSEEQRNLIIQAAQSALQPGKSGAPLLTWSEYSYLIRNIGSNSGLKQAESLIAYREKVDKEDSIKNVERQSQAIQAQQQTSGQIEQQRLALENELSTGQKTTVQQQKFDLELRNDTIKEEGLKDTPNNNFNNN